MIAELSKTAVQQDFTGRQPKWELADIFRTYGDQYLALHPTPTRHKQIMQDIMLCRTAYLGGHLRQCDTCGAKQTAYNSCRNRHCPKCQALVKARWLEARTAELLPVTYFHGVFTLPHDINPIALCNKVLIFNMLFKAASQTLLCFGKNPKNGLGGRLGFTAILHTWDQMLKSHLHLHCIVPGGALSSDSTRWIPVKGDYLFCTLAMSKVFQGKFMALLIKAYEKGTLRFSGKAKAYAAKDDFKRLYDTLWAKDWVVYAKPPFGSPQQVLDYLGRYTHRVAISNQRIVNVAEGQVTFTYRDRKDNDTLKQTTLSAERFIGRFLLHVLPNQFMRIRHFGFLANRAKKEKLPLCRHALGICSDLPELENKSPQQLMLELVGIDITLCPACKKGTLRVIEKLPKQPDVCLFDLFN